MTMLLDGRLRDLATQTDTLPRNASTRPRMRQTNSTASTARKIEVEE